jgi:hypothetical protein
MLLFTQQCKALPGGKKSSHPSGVLGELEAKRLAAMDWFSDTAEVAVAPLFTLGD